MACTVAAVAVLAGGCSMLSGGSKPSASPAVAGNHGNAAAGAARVAGAVAPVVRVPLKVPNSVTARKGVTLSDCAASKDGGHAAGMVTDLGKNAAAYTITVFFTTSKATVIGYATTMVHATPGKAIPWQASSHFSAPPGMRCVLRGVSAG